MSTQSDLEIYRQRYETFRHLDKLRWQMLQIAVATAGVALAFGGSDDQGPDWWTLIAIGLILVLLAVAMIRIGHGIDKNGDVLRAAGSSVGDDGIPAINSWYSGASFWVATVMGAVGIGCIVLGMWMG